MLALAAGTLRHGYAALLATFVVAFGGALALLVCAGLVESGNEALVPVGAVFGGLCVLLTVIVVGSTLSLVVRQRSRELSLLRAIGAAPSQLRRALAAEVVSSSVVAFVLACPVSLVVGRILLDALARGDVVSSDQAFRQGPISLACAFVATIGTGLGGVVIVSRGLRRVRPVEALGAASRTRAMSVPRGLCALLCIAGGVTLSLVTERAMHGPIASATAGPAALLWAGGLALLAPTVGQVVGLTAGPVLTWFAPGFVGVRNSVRRPVETAGVVTPVMLVVGLAGALLLMRLDDAASAPAPGGSTDAWINNLLIVLIVGYAGVSLINSSAAAICGRRDELSRLRLAGMSRSGALTMIGVESVVAAVAGVILGLVVIVAVVWPYDVAVGGPSLEAATTSMVVAGVAGGALLVTVAVMQVVGRFATRRLVPGAVVG